MGDEHVQVDSQLLFQRLITAGERCGDLPLLFMHEMCSYPTALFESPGLMRISNKSLLADSIWNICPSIESHISDNRQYVLDGGSLLHRLPWIQGLTFGQICDMYVQFVLNKYGKAIVFDGYENGPSTKDSAHQRRTKGKPGVLVNFTSGMKNNINKYVFLSNKKNKHRFIHMLSGQLAEQDCKLYHAPGDADVLIAKMTVKTAKNIDTVLVADDTDLLVLLCYYVDQEAHDVYLTSDKRRMSNKPPIIWNIKATRTALSPSLCNHLLFIHAFLGCDTTSRIQGIGKSVILKKMLKGDQILTECADIFHGESTVQDIATAGERALLQLYKGSVDQALDQLRYMLFCQKTAARTVHVKLQNLPPTSASMSYHSMRTYYQIHEWLCNTSIKAEQWGWTLKDDILVPIQTDMPPATKSLLEAIHCNCKSDCQTNRCGCRKHGLECSVSCGECRGVSCSNAQKPNTDPDDDDISTDITDNTV